MAPFLTFETQTYATLADAERAYTAFRTASLDDLRPETQARVLAFWNALVRADKRAKGIRLEQLPRKLTTDGGWADMLARKEARRLARHRDEDFGPEAA